MRDEDPCMTLALEKSDHLRAYGTATSYVEKIALAEAERDARNRMAQMMKVAIEGAAQDYAQNTNQNLRNTATALGEQVMTQYVAEEIKGSRVIKTTIYDLSDGQIMVSVCIEQSDNLAAANKKLENELDRSGVITAQYDRDRFIAKTAAGLEEYKARQRQEYQQQPQE